MKTRENFDILCKCISLGAVKKALSVSNTIFVCNLED